MKVLYYYDELPATLTKSIFLAGPTPRNNATESWRPAAIKLLRDSGYDGVVIVPEPENPSTDFPYDYKTTFAWERRMINACDVILFWIPRAELLPGYTTNIEYGNFIKTGKVAVGAPVNAYKIRYLQELAKEQGIPWFTTLEETVKNALDLIGVGAERVGAEVMIPLNIYRKNEFRNWYDAQLLNGNELRSFTVEYVFNNAFIWVARAEIYIKAEKRTKANELMFARTDMASMVLYCPEEKKLVLVKEFRLPVANREGMVYEVAGGMLEKNNPKEQAIKEVAEETGISVAADRVIFVGTRQAAATLSPHLIHLYAVNISVEELEHIERSTAGKAFGNSADTEMTYVSIKTVDELLDEKNADWINIGMILNAIRTLYQPS